MDNQVVETYTYGGVGGVASQRATTVEGQSVSQGFAWTDLGLPGSVTYPQIAGIGPARTVSDTYTNGFLTSVPSYATGITYSVNTMLYQITHANAVVATYGLDGNRIQRIAGVTTTGASSNNLALTPFAYDGAGDVKAIGSQTFVYDKVSRLVTGNILANNTPKTQSAAFDAFGNITSTTTTDWGVQTFSLNAATNRLNSPVTYDAAGDVTYWGGYTYTWDALGKMQTVSGTGINHTYLYTADGERISDRDSLGGTTTLTVRGLDGKVLRIYVKSGSTWSWSKDYVYQQGMLLASVDASTTRHFDLDHLGTPRLITGSGGTTLAIHDYYPFGMEAYGTADGERMKFTGHELDWMGTAGQGDDLYNMHARYYNSNIARFISADLLRGDPHSPQSFNLFAYVGGNPISRFDPFGLASQKATEVPCPPDVPGPCYGEGITVAGDVPPIALSGIPGLSPLTFLFRSFPIGFSGVRQMMLAYPAIAHVKKSNPPCESSFGERVQKNANITTDSIVGLVLEHVSGAVVSESVAAASGTTTVYEWVKANGLRSGIVLRGVTFTWFETSVLAVSAEVAGGVVIAPLVFKGGVYVGSVINVAASPCNAFGGSS